MNALFAGLYLETAGVVWDMYMHFSGAAGGEGLIEPAHALIFAGFIISFISAILVRRNVRRQS